MDEKRLLIGSDSNGMAHVLRTDTLGRLEIVTQRPVVAARVYNNANISVPDSTWTALNFNSEVFDTDGMHSSVTNTDRLTVVTPGTYLIGGQLAFAANGAGIRGIEIFLNGATVIGEVNDIPVGTGNWRMAIAPTLYQLIAGDYLQLRAYQTSGGDLYVNYYAAYSPVFWAVMM